MSYQWIDTVVALEQLGGSDKLYKSVLLGFYDRYRHVDQSIRSMLEHKEYEEARRTAHSIKGLSGNLGTSDLREKAFKLEVAIRDQSENIELCMEGFSRSLNEVVKEIVVLCKEYYQMSLIPEVAEEQHKNKSQFKEACQQLSLALESHRYSEVQKARKAIETVPVPEEAVESMTVVFQAIEDFDYDLANEALRKLMTIG